MGRMAEVVVQVYRDASRRTGLTFVFIDKVFQIVGEFNVVTFVGRQRVHGWWWAAARNQIYATRRG